MVRWLPALLSAALLLPVADAAAKKRCGTKGKTVEKIGSTRVYAFKHKYYACQRGKTKFLWSGVHTADEEISFGDPRVAGRWLAFVDYYCTLSDGYHVATIVRVDMRGSRRDRLPALTTPPRPHVRPRVTRLELAADGGVAWTAELGPTVEQHAAPA